MSEAYAELSPGPDWVLRWLAIPNPGAGATWSLTVPGDFEWRVVALQQTFTTTAVPGDRVPGLVLRSATRELIRVPAGLVVPPSSGLRIQWAAGLGALFGGLVEGQIIAPLPPLPLVPGLALDALVIGLGLGDTLTSITLTVFERFTGEHRPARERRPTLVRPLDPLATVEG